MKYWIIGVWAIVVLVFLPVTIWEIKVQTADIKGRGDAQIQIHSGTNRILKYNEFFDLCVSVQNAEATIDSETARLATTQDTETLDHINQNISNANITRARGINIYNANAKKNYTDAQFRASNLPYQLSTEAYTAGGQHTQCAV